MERLAAADPSKKLVPVAAEAEVAVAVAAEAMIVVVEALVAVAVVAVVAVVAAWTMVTRAVAAVLLTTCPATQDDLCLTSPAVASHERSRLKMPLERECISVEDLAAGTMRRTRFRVCQLKGISPSVEACRE